MTMHDILSTSRNELYLNGTDAYIRRMGTVCGRAKKSGFAALLKGCDDVIVFVNVNTAKKYSRALNHLGYMLKGRADYSRDEYVLYYERFSMAQFADVVSA